MTIEQLEYQITLEEIKEHLNIDYDDNYYDSMLYEYIATSLAYIIKACGGDWVKDEYCVKLAKIVQKKFIADMFENKGTEISNSTKRDVMVNTILEILASGGE